MFIDRNSRSGNSPMKLQHSLPSFGAQMHKILQNSGTLFVQSYRDGGGSIAVSAARQRLALAADRCHQRRGVKNEVYYGAGSQLEETIEGIFGNQAFDAIVTRNHYGSLVLNA